MMLQLKVTAMTTDANGRINVTCTSVSPREYPASRLELTLLMADSRDYRIGDVVLVNVTQPNP